MLPSYPKLKPGQVTLARADINTGIVLDEYFKYTTTPTQKVFTICNNVEEAIVLAVSIIMDNIEIECLIANKENSLLHYIDRNNVATYKRSE